MSKKELLEILIAFDFAVRSAIAEFTNSNNKDFESRIILIEKINRAREIVIPIIVEESK